MRNITSFQPLERQVIQFEFSPTLSCVLFQKRDLPPDMPGRPETWVSHSDLNCMYTSFVAKNIFFLQVHATNILPTILDNDKNCPGNS